MTRCVRKPLEMIVYGSGRFEVGDTERPKVEEVLVSACGALHRDQVLARADVDAVAAERGRDRARSKVWVGDIAGDPRYPLHDVKASGACHEQEVAALSELGCVQRIERELGRVELAGTVVDCLEIAQGDRKAFEVA